MSAILTTVLSKDGDEMRIKFSASRRMVVREVWADGRLQARGPARRNASKENYRGDIRRMAKWGWVVQQSSETDLM